MMRIIGIIETAMGHGQVSTTSSPEELINDIQSVTPCVYSPGVHPSLIYCCFYLNESIISANLKSPGCCDVDLGR